MKAAEKRENEVGGKIKGSEFIFVLIATELRNCLTSKIAPAQANYIHLLCLLAPVLLNQSCPFHPNNKRISSLIFHSSSRPPSSTHVRYAFCLFVIHGGVVILSRSSATYLVGVILCFYYLTTLYV